MWKPRRQRASTEGQWWQDLQAGHAASNVSEESDDEYYVAMLYLPDPDSRTGWQAHGVERRKPEASPRSFGFGPGAKE